jgi:hypothetical protein
VPIQETRGYALGFGIPTIAFGVAIFAFLAGSALYVKFPPQGSPFARLFRVLRGAWRNRKLPLPADPSELYEDDPNAPLVPSPGSATSAGLGGADDGTGDKVSPLPTAAAAARNRKRDRWLRKKQKGASVAIIDRIPHTPGMAALDKVRFLFVWLVGLCVSDGAALFLRRPACLSRCLSLSLLFPRATPLAPQTKNTRNERRAPTQQQTPHQQTPNEQKPTTKQNKQLNKTKKQQTKNNKRKTTKQTIEKQFEKTKRRPSAAPRTASRPPSSRSPRSRSPRPSTASCPSLPWSSSTR